MSKIPVKNTISIKNKMFKFLFSKPLFLYDGSIKYSPKFKTCREILKELECETESSKSIFLYQQQILKEKYNKYLLEMIKRNEPIGDIIDSIKDMNAPTKDTNSSFDSTENINNMFIRDINEIIEDYIEDNESEINQLFSKVQFTRNDILVTMKYDGRVFSMIDAINYWRKEKDKN